MTRQTTQLIIDQVVMSITLVQLQRHLLHNGLLVTSLKMILVKGCDSNFVVNFSQILKNATNETTTLNVY